MITTFKAKIIFESDFLDSYEGQEPKAQTATGFNWVRMKEKINGKKCNMQLILNEFFSDGEPTIIIRQEEV